MEVFFRWTNTCEQRQTSNEARLLLTESLWLPGDFFSWCCCWWRPFSKRYWQCQGFLHAMQNRSSSLEQWSLPSLLSVSVHSRRCLFPWCTCHFISVPPIQFLAFVSGDSSPFVSKCTSCLYTVAQVRQQKGGLVLPQRAIIYDYILLLCCSYQQRGSFKRDYGKSSLLVCLALCVLLCSMLLFILLVVGNF